MRNHLFIVSIVALFPAALLAQIRGNLTVSGRANLPYTFSDATGNQWQVYPQGFLRQAGNNPLFGQAAMLIVNGNTPSAGGAANLASIDQQTGELVIDNLRAGNITITRRIQFNRTDGWVRYVDVFKNSTGQDQSINLQYNSSYNFGVQNAVPVYDPSNKDHLIGAAVMMQTGRAVFETFAGKGAKTIPQINPQPNNNSMQAAMQLTVPGGKQVALMHLHGTSATAESAAQQIVAFKEGKIVSDLPLELRKSIVNIAGTQTVGDREILRGDMLDVVELRDADQLKGNVAESSYKLDTFYGPIELPADQVVGLISVGQYRPRQLIITSNGEVFGGTLSKDSITVEMSTGQKTNVPLTQISRVGYRKRSSEPQEWTLDKPMISLRSGERLMIALPGNPIEIMTGLGLLKIPPQSIASISFQPEEPGVHQIQLIDGSQFSGVVTADSFQFQLAGAASQQKVTINSATIERITLAAKPAEVDDDTTPLLRLTNRDQLVGTLSGQLQLETRFDKIAIAAGSLRSLTHSPQTPLDVQATLWDQSTLGGQLLESVIPFTATSGMTINVPVAMLQSYSNPQSRPGDAAADKIKEIIKQLGADDWKTREQAEAQLVQMGPNIVPVLKDLMTSQSPEAKLRIESILTQLDPKRAKPAPSGGGE
ncbi:MAG TPA: hypothetical protein VHD56_17675 [Tepidisphaeraceae bacterium]|nr:hypothetical protein [Tepidisphaeraceae bacterium]